MQKKQNEKSFERVLRGFLRVTVLAIIVFILLFINGVIFNTYLYYFAIVIGCPILLLGGLILFFKFIKKVVKMSKNEEIEDIEIVPIIVAILLGVLGCTYNYKYFLDIPDLLTSKYQYVDGYINIADYMGYYDKKDLFERKYYDVEVDVKDVRLSTNTKILKPLYSKTYRVKYLKNSKYALSATPLEDN